MTDDAPKRKGRPRIHANKADANRAWRLRQDPEKMKQARRESYLRWKAKRDAKASA